MPKSSPQASRAIVYCVVPRSLAGKLHEPLRRHFADDPTVEVVVEQREGDRRQADDRRVGHTPREDERRHVRAVTGRRVGDRRMPVVEGTLPPLPRRLRSYASRLRFVERLEPSRQQMEDRDTARLVMRFQAGEREVVTEIYLRYFDRVYSYLYVALRDEHEAEDVTQQVFMQVLEALPRYERRGSPFRAWLFVIARNCVLGVLRKTGRLEYDDAETLNTRRETLSARMPDDSNEAFDWVSDRELMMFVERLPLAQRQVLVLRFMLGLTYAETARALDRSEASVRMLQSRALTYLRQRLSAVGRDSRQRARMVRWPRQARILRARRFALLAPGPVR